LDVEDYRKLLKKRKKRGQSEVEKLPEPPGPPRPRRVMVKKKGKKKGGLSLFR
jgi:hypothetical protein